MKIKPGVDLRNLQPQMVLAALIAERVYQPVEQLVITSGMEGAHMVGSLHYKGLALDFRLPTGSVNNIVHTLRENLGAQYDVVLEATHVHIEYDPK